jgi:hypothetical protein
MLPLQIFDPSAVNVDDVEVIVRKLDSVSGSVAKIENNATSKSQIMRLCFETSQQNTYSNAVVT